VRARENRSAGGDDRRGRPCRGASWRADWGAGACWRRGAETHANNDVHQDGIAIKGGRTKEGGGRGREAAMCGVDEMGRAGVRAGQQVVGGWGSVAGEAGAMVGRWG